MAVLRAIGEALTLAGTMTWEILWALILGFALSAVVQAAVVAGHGAPLDDCRRPR